MIFFHRVTACTVLGVCRIFGCVFASTDNSCSILLPQVSISLRIIGILNLIIVIRNRGFKLSKSIAGVGTQLKINRNYNNVLYTCHTSVLSQLIYYISKLVRAL